MRQHGLSDDGERIVLHRFHGGVDTTQPVGSTPIHRFLFADVESTGLQPGVDRMIELALAEVDVQVETGLVVAHHGTESWLEDPGIHIPPEITELTGITDGDVRGQKIPDDTVRARFEAARVVVAHNASFDRAMSVARFPWLGEPGAPPWACSLEQIAWRGYGHRHADLESLAKDHGFFYSGHRATIDAEVLIKLLAMRPAEEAPPYLSDLVADIRHTLRCQGRAEAAGLPLGRRAEALVHLTARIRAGGRAGVGPRALRAAWTRPADVCEDSVYASLRPGIRAGLAGRLNDPLTLARRLLSPWPSTKSGSRVTLNARRSDTLVGQDGALE
jgi:DNA polymerase III epsilon subunit-like protein